jgi:hypothetical protein
MGKVERKMRRARVEQVVKQAPEKLRIFIGTPAGGGGVSTETCDAVELFQSALAVAGHDVTWCRQSWSGLDRTRNIMVAIARKEAWTHLLWVDRDMIVPVEVLVSMVFAPFDVVGLGYPKKAIDWSRVLRGAEKLLRAPNVDPRALAFTASPNVGTLDESLTIEEWGGRRFALARELGTGVMSVKMAALDAYIRENEAELAYRTDYLEGEQETHHAVFLAKLGPEPQDERRYLTEDFAFTRAWTRSGRKAWMMLDARVGHVGRHTFWSDLTGWRPSP